MKHVNVRKLALAGILVAVGIVCSPLSIPVGASKCAPVQHFINILGGVFPWACLCGGNGVRHKPSAQSSGNRDSACLSRIHVRRFPVRDAV